MTFGPTPILDDLRILELYELAMRHDVRVVANRSGNWVQSYSRDEDALLFATAQFRRYRELVEKYLARLGDANSIASRIRRDTE